MISEVSNNKPKKNKKKKEKVEDPNTRMPKFKYNLAPEYQHVKS